MGKDITEEDLLDELKHSFEEAKRNKCTIQPGEFTYKVLSKTFGISERALYDKMKPLIESGEWETADRINERGFKVIVFRKAGK